MKTFLIWSIEHGAYWAPNSQGYTTRRSKAGRYDQHKAKEIVDGANQFIEDGNPPHEAMIPVDE